MPEYLQVQTTTDNKERALEIARKAVEKNLAACAQISGPITSLFWWKNNINREEEWLVIMKTKKDLYHELERTIKKIHTYEVPEIIGLSIVEGNQEYLDWIERETA